MLYENMLAAVIYSFLCVRSMCNQSVVSRQFCLTVPEAGQLTTYDIPYAHTHRSTSSITTVRTDNFGVFLNLFFRFVYFFRVCEFGISVCIHDLVFLVVCSIKLNSTFQSREKKVLKFNEKFK